MIPALNNLRIVELSCLIFHEAHDPTRLARVREEIAAEAVQRNPVIFAPHEDRYLLLDGAHRACPGRTRLSLRPGAACRAPREGGELDKLLDDMGLLRKLSAS